MNRCVKVNRCARVHCGMLGCSGVAMCTVACWDIQVYQGALWHAGMLRCAKVFQDGASTSVKRGSCMTLVQK